MRYTILTIFPEVVTAYMQTSIMGRAQDSGAITVVAQDIRAYAHNKHHTVDDTPYGGGAGMIMQVAPIDRALCHVRAEMPHASTRTVLLSAKGARYTQADARRLATYEHLILICGRYEGVDERVATHLADEEISIGDYVLTGGELGAMVIVDSVARLLSGVLGNDASSMEESHCTEGYLEYPQYTKPALYKGLAVPDVLLSGDHAKIAAWRTAQSVQRAQK